MSNAATLAAAAPAGGAATGQVIAMVVALSVGFGALVASGEAQRRGRRTPLGTLAAFSARLSGLPIWAALPLAVTGIALVGALFGYMWDVSLHIDRGRDAGPFANPSHYFILVGLYGIVAGGYLSTVLVRPGEQPGRSALRIAPDHEVPLGGALIAAAGAFALFGFPLDDLWHRLFGQDVTLWGPTHLIMLSGGLLTLVGVVVLFEEGVATSARGSGLAIRHVAMQDLTPRSVLARLADLIPAVPLWPTRALIAGGFLAGLSIYQGEFDYGVPQFELVLQPLMIAGSAALALVAARVWIGRGGAIGAVLFYLLIRGGVWLVVGPILGRTHPAMPLYVPEALLVEAVALALIRRPLLFGPVAGLAAGAIGFAGEWPWVNSVYAIHWYSGLLPEGPIIAAIAGAAGGTIGVVFGLALKRRLPERPRLQNETGRASLRSPRPRTIAIGSLVAIMGCFAFGLADRTPSGDSAQITLTQVKPPPNREVTATVRFNPPDVADGASWVREIAWQGGGLVGAQLERIGPGVYRTPEPLPVHGEWKAALRIENGHTLLGVPIYAPADPAIPAPGVAATPTINRPLENDRELLQRERKRDVPGWLWMGASLTVLILALAFLTLLSIALARYARGPRRAEQPEAAEPRREAPAMPSPASGARA